MSAGAGAVVALDGFGVERGFEVLADGVRRAVGDGISVRIFGPPDELGLEDVAGVEVIPTTDWISNDDDPVSSVDTRPEASVVRAVADVAAGNADAVVSHGSTGAAMAAATFRLKRIHGVRRPALAAQVPVPGHQVLLLDAGANSAARPQHLVQFAFLGSAFSQAVLSIGRPRVALLSIGEEPAKGNDDVVEAHQVLAGSEGINFIGNVEGGDVLAGAADVVVTDGFTGNVAIKVMEGTAKVVTGAVRDAARKNPLSAAGGLLLKPALGSLRRQLDPDTTGGVILLGLRHIAVVGHGGAGADGVTNAIRLAARGVDVDAVTRTAELLASSGVGRRGLRRDAPDATAE